MKQTHKFNDYPLLNSFVRFEEREREREKKSDEVKEKQTNV